MAQIQMVSYTQKNRKNYATPNEDYSLSSADKHFAAVADGVTHMRVNGAYPNH